MGLHELKPAPGAKKQPRRVGRGIGSGLGKTSGKGHKGQKSRSGGTKGPGFEGGQMPLQRRIPKRGFFNVFRTDMEEVNVSQLNLFNENDVITHERLKAAGLIKGNRDGVKILGNGSLEKSLVVRANRFSKSAVAKIEGAGGKAEVI